MFPQVSGSVFVSTQYFSREHKDSAAATLAAALKTEVQNLTFISSDPIIYTRPYFQRGRMDISSFSSGRIDIQNDRDGLRIRFVLGVLPFVEQVFMMVPAYLLLLGGGVPETIAFPFIVVVEAVILARIVYTWTKVRAWFVSTVSSAINRNEPGDRA